MRALLFVTALALVGCGDDGGASAAIDMAQPMLGLGCGESHCMGACGSCDPFAGGICNEACKLEGANTCPAGKQCRVLDDGDGGIRETLSGDCAGFDGVCGL